MEEMPGVILLVLLVFAGLLSMRLVAAEIYDVLIVHMTEVWYREVLTRLKPGERVLDIGIGTAAALIKNKALIEKKQLTIVGVDYDACYIKKAKKLIKDHGLQDRVAVHCASVYDKDLSAIVLGTLSEAPSQKERNLFTAAYFSGSFTLLPDPVAALHVAASLLQSDTGGDDTVLSSSSASMATSAPSSSSSSSRIYITQTFQRKRSPFIAIIKPLLKYITTIDFGQLTYESDLQKVLENSHMQVVGNEVIAGSLDNAKQVARIVTLAPHTSERKEK